MCLIIDANRACVVFDYPTPVDFLPLFDWIEQRGGVVIIGGRLRRELYKVDRAKRRIKEWVRAGRAFIIDESLVDKLESEIAVGQALKSDDPHVIALAQLSGARVLCTEDRNLIVDFKDKRLIDKPRGAVYRTQRHKKLLQHHGSCRHGDRLGS